MKWPSFKYSNHCLVLLLLFLLAFLLYHHVLQGEFVSDDFMNIVDSDAIRDPFNPLRIWQGLHTRFLVGWTFSWNYYFGGLNPGGYHVVNVLVHVLNAFMVYCLTLLTLNTPLLKPQYSSSVSRKISFLASLLFLCHPIQTQGVTFVTQRFVLMSTLFYLMTLTFYILSRTSGQKRYFVLALLSMALGVFCKENMLTLPLALWGADFFFWPKEKGRVVESLKRVVPFVLLAGLIPLMLAFDTLGSHYEFKNQLASRSFNVHYFLTEINVLVTYLRLMVFPVSLTHDYDYPIVQSLFELKTLLSSFLLAGLAGMGVRLFQKDRLTSFCIFWFFLTTSVEVAVVCVVNRGVIYEHWLYLPMVGFSVLAAILVVRLVRNARLFRIVSAAVICVLCVLTYQRNFVWQNEIVFWEDNLDKAPNSPRVCFAAGTAYFRKGLLTKAESLIAQALRLNASGGDGEKPLNNELASRALNNIGLLNMQGGRPLKARKAFQDAVDLYPGNAQAHNNLGISLVAQGELLKAQEHIQKSMRLQGEHAHGWYHLGQISMLEGNFSEAKAQFLKAGRLFELNGNAFMAQAVARLLEGM